MLFPFSISAKVHFAMEWSRLPTLFNISFLVWGYCDWYLHGFWLLVVWISIVRSITSTTSS